MKKRCGACDSQKIIENLAITDRIDALNSFELSIPIQRKPDALFFKDKRNHPLRASVCGNCGKVELSIEDPARFYEDFLESKNR